MGKASSRRRARRQAYLGRLAKEHPVRFWEEWSKRLESWSKEADRRARFWKDKEGNRLPSAFSLMDEAMSVLQGCGREALELEAEQTLETIADSCSRAVARAVDRRMYRLGQLGELARSARSNGLLENGR
jgi:hypothetical protein